MAYPNLKRMPNPPEVVVLLEYIKLLKVYLTDDHSVEMSDEYTLEVLKAEQIIDSLVAP